jgi:hypothetical protein
MTVAATRENRNFQNKLILCLADIADSPDERINKISQRKGIP